MTADLFGTPEPIRNEPRVWSVGELTRAIRSLLEDSIGGVWVEGEVSNYRRQPSGHQYFTLKDAQSQVSCVWFARPGLKLRQLQLTEGMQVQIRGALTVYEARGQYQINVQSVQAAGAGLLQAKFEALKKKLEAEGLFAAEGKRPLPRFPVRIGIVTSPAAAALRDILHVLARRAPWVHLIIQPVRVQGEGAAREIAAGIAELNRLPEFGHPPVDVILVARGGGSVEDLWQFNEESVARAIAASAIPTVSAVGHETDFTIADFVADVRAPTPSAAAEILVPDAGELQQRLLRLRSQVQRALLTLVAAHRRRLDVLARTALFREPSKRVSDAAQRLDFATESLRRAVRSPIEDAGQQLKSLAASLRHHRPDQLLALRRLRFDGLRLQLADRLHRALKERQDRFERISRIIQLLGPDTLLSRGYSMTTTEDGRLVRSVRDVLPKSVIVTKLRDGSIRSVTE